MYTVKPTYGSSKPALRECNWESGPDRKIAPNTFRTTLNSLPVIRFHYTFIVIALPHKRYQLNTGGYRTSTTKQRLNSLLPNGIQVYQRNFNWYVSTPDHPEVPFRDGMVV